MEFNWMVPPGRLMARPSERDMCWLDCSAPGIQVTCGLYEIFLCKDHRADLMNGEPPRGSEATQWPWRRREVTLVDPLEVAV